MANKVDDKSDQPCRLSHQFLKEITKDYDETLLLGTGAFGRVYKGIYKDGKEIAVKALLNMTGIDNKEFQKEFENLRRLKHPNVVQLVGFCNEAEKVLVEHNGNQLVADKMHTALCFEYVCNGSLDTHIPEVGCSGLNWHMTYKIIKGICQGLEYLRHGLEFSVWHLDLKPANILLGNDMTPKIVDFGLSKLLGDENTRKTISAIGTGGYLPPEYIEHGLITKGFDIFSLGVIIAKLMAGREDYFKIDSMKEKIFIKHVHDNWRGKLRETLAPRQLEVYCEQVKICIEIAVKCMSRDRQDRPTIQLIVNNLIETEKLIGKLGPQTEQFRGGEPIPPERGIHATLPDMAVDASRGKLQNGKAHSMELPLQLLQKITNDFSHERILGHGVFGKIYKGILEDGEVIAVKKNPENIKAIRRSLFIRELETIAALKHENAVQLVGFCVETTGRLVQNHNGRHIADIVESLACYEYLPKGNLQKYLYEESSSIDWETRFKIIKGICQGLLFLHSNNIIHFNLHPRNILLDNDMRPKIDDYVKSRLFGSEYARKNRTEPIRLVGYMDPDYLYSGQTSRMTDIYSLGLIIMEISTGEKKCPNTDINSARIFVDRVRKTNWTDERIALEYPSFDEDCLHQIRACINIGLECMAFDQKRRPSIGQVVDMLNGLQKRGSDGVLSLQPRQINFPIGPKRLASSSLYLTNSKDERVAFRLATSCKIPRRYLTKLPLIGIVPPKCAYTLTVITREQKRTPACDDFLTVRSSITRNEDLDDVDPASMAVFLDSTTAGDEAQEVKVAVDCELPAETIPNQIIDGKNYQEVLSVNVHATEPWILTSNKGGYVCIWNYQTQAEVNSVQVGGEPVYSAKFIERQEWFVVGSEDGYIYVYNYITMEDVVDGIKAHDGHRILSLAVNPSDSFVLSASDDHTIKLWDWTNGWQCVRTFEGHDDTVTQVMFDPRNSKSFASSSLDHTVKIWNIHSATCNITWDEHPDGLLCVHYHPRYFQQFLISGSSDGAAKVWDLETDSCVDTLQEHAKGVTALSWHPELRVLVTGSLDRTVRIWNWETTSDTYRLENIIGLNLGAINALGYLKESTRIVVGCDQGIALMEINVCKSRPAQSRQARRKANKEIK